MKEGTQPEKRWSGVKPLNRIPLNKKQHEKEKEALLYDVVTGLPKHDLLNERLNMLIAELNHEPKNRLSNLTALLAIAFDLDNLRVWNKYGHPTGDEALAKIAQAIKGSIRKESGDYVCRLGANSDEFFAILRIEKNLSESALDEIFQNIKTQVNSKSVEVKGVELPVTAAMGYTVIREGQMPTAEAVIEAADANQLSDKDQDTKAKRIREATERLVGIKE